MPTVTAFADLHAVPPPGHVPGEARGVSTTCWGPRAWAVLHGLSFHVHAGIAPRVARLVTLLAFVLPCSFCRESWPAFVEQLVAATGVSVEAHVRAGTFARFLYDAHNLVNDKLERQRWAATASRIAGNVARALGGAEGLEGRESRGGSEGSGCSAPTAADVERALLGVADAAVFSELDKRPTFEVVQKRYFLAHETPFTSHDVWQVLSMFALNFSSANAAAFVEFVDVLAQCVAEVPAGALQETARVLAFTARQLAACDLAALQQDKVKAVLALGRAACDGVPLHTPDDRRNFVDAVCSRTEVAAAGACLNGVCR